MSERYLKKIEILERELEYINRLKEFNGIRNAVVHTYNNLEMTIIKEALERIAEFAEVIFTIAE